jgi:hypothetical protein
VIVANNHPFYFDTRVDVTTARGGRLAHVRAVSCADTSSFKLIVGPESHLVGFLKDMQNDELYCKVYGAAVKMYANGLPPPPQPTKWRQLVAKACYSRNYDYDTSHVVHDSLSLSDTDSDDEFDEVNHIHTSETTRFLTDTKLIRYSDAMAIHGYTDIFLIKCMSKIELKSFYKDVKMFKPGHQMKFEHYLSQIIMKPRRSHYELPVNCLFKFDKSLDASNYPTYADTDVVLSSMFGNDFYSLSRIKPEDKSAACEHLMQVYNMHDGVKTRSSKSADDARLIDDMERKRKDYN